jgi:hypothetical protein
VTNHRRREVGCQTRPSQRGGLPATARNAQRDGGLEAADAAVALRCKDHLRRQRTLPVPAGARRAERRRGGVSPQVRRGIPLGGARGGPAVQRAGHQPHPRPAALVRPDARACLRRVRRGLARRARAAHGGGRRAGGAAAWRDMGARTQKEARSFIVSSLRRRLGLVICREFARHRTSAPGSGRLDLSLAGRRASRRTRSQRVAVVVAQVAPALLRSSSMEVLERPIVPKVRPIVATSATTAGRPRCRVRGRLTPTRVAGTPCGGGGEG